MAPSEGMQKKAQGGGSGRRHAKRGHRVVFNDAQVVQNEGVKALAIGLGPTLFRNCIWNSIFYGSMHEMPRMRRLPNPAAAVREPGCTGLSEAAAGE
eukprot:scaffold57732_cov15-Tisochrysis_lutea.AAC.1